MIESFDKYIQKHPPFAEIRKEEMQKSDIVVVIPAYLEDDLKRTIDSLVNCYEVEARVTVFVVVNASVNSSAYDMAHQEATIKEIERYR